jgi:biotin carboxyl carrier protein
MFKATVNEDYTFEIALEDDQITIDGQKFTVDNEQTGASAFHLLQGHTSCKAEVLDFDSEEKIFTILISGREYRVQVADRYDILLEKLGMDEMVGAQINQVEAPMPGKVLSVHVEEGDEVSKDQKLLVLEAMKMENVIKAPGDGTIKTVHIADGETVDKKQLLIELE